MEHIDFQSIEKLIYNKILLYDDLLHCVMEERNSLINIDLDKLWQISKEKTEICLKIEAIRKEILSTVNRDMNQKKLDLNNIPDLAPPESKPKFHKLFIRLIRLKAEIDALRKENVNFMDDSLSFLDEMVSIIAGETKARIVYNDKCHLSKPVTNILLSREV
jgi:flagellar FlgN protein